MTKKMTAGVSALFAVLALTACNGDSEPVTKTFQPSGQTSSIEKKTSAASNSGESSESKTSITPGTKTEKPLKATGPELVSEADYTPADGPNARLFQLEDGQTKCFMNDMSGDAYLACSLSMANPPTVQDAAGQDTPANAVSWNPSGVTYEVLQFPQTNDINTLHPNQRLQAYGYTCDATGASSVTCSGAPGTATIDNGTVTGATVPPRKEAPQQPGPASPGLPGQAQGQQPALPSLNLPAPGDVIPGLGGR